MRYFLNDSILVVRTSPINWTAAIVSEINRNTSDGQPFRVPELDSAVDFVAVWITHQGAIVESLLAVALVAGVLHRKHGLTLPIQLSLEVTRAEFFDLFATNGGTRCATTSPGVLIDAVFPPCEELGTFVASAVE